MYGNHPELGYEWYSTVIRFIHKNVARCCEEIAWPIIHKSVVLHCNVIT